MAVMSMLFAAGGRSSVDLMAHNTREVRDRGPTIAGALGALSINLETLAAMTVVR